MPTDRQMKIHVVQYAKWNHSTEREEVFAYCGAYEEAGGSGKHDMVLDPADSNCPTCIKLYNEEYGNLSKT